MPKPFLQLPETDRKAILTKAAQELGRAEHILEKDIWVCWTLKKLLQMPGVPPLAFKGGTSLSKAHNAIARFSEDVDVTLDRNTLSPELDPFTQPSRTKTKQVCAELDEKLASFMQEAMKPYFDEQLGDELGIEKAEAKIGEAAGQLLIPYPTCAGESNDYVSDSIILELGNKNSIQPTEPRSLTVYLAELDLEVEFPEVVVPVLAAERTFWEKATLVHAECNRNPPRANVRRLSRHWYDLAKLAESAIGSSAISDDALLNDVVKTKNTIYYAAYARYEDCLTGGLRLVPDDPLARKLKADFLEMRENGMFWDDPGSFEAILAVLAAAQELINRKRSADS